MLCQEEAQDKINDAVVIITDVFGWRLPNIRLIADKVKPHSLCTRMSGHGKGHSISNSERCTPHTCTKSVGDG